MSNLLAFLRDEAGASAAEYALILAAIGAGVAAAAVFLGGSVANAMNDAGACISAPSTGTC